MHRLLLIPAYLLLFIVSCDRRHAVEINTLPLDRVYSIVAHGDSLYFSTQNKGIFRVHPETPDSVTPVASLYAAPFRSFLFTRDNGILAASYEQGVFTVTGNRMTPLPGLPRVVWRIRQDPISGNCWFATERGVFVASDTGYAKFCALPDAHDIAFTNDHIAVAHLAGISVFHRKSAALLGEWCKGQSTWVVETIEGRFVGGGGPYLLIIDPMAGFDETIMLKNNYLWSLTPYADGGLLLGTQRGVFLVPKGSKKSVMVALKDVCVKSIAVDKAGRVWAGRFWSGLAP